MPLFGRVEKLKEQHQKRLERLKAGRFFDVACELGHRSQMSGVDLCRRLDKWGEKVFSPECYKWVKLVGITDGPSMSEEQKKQQQDDYLKWSEEREKERRRQRDSIMQQEAALAISVERLNIKPICHIQSPPIHSPALPSITLRAPSPNHELPQMSRSNRTLRQIPTLA